ncbi:MAG TPA: ABC transporter permease [Acidisoma sp.]|uniref:ABC transporter permease n=1 Tax=Acidisoma sp. TaxID=1872115 RepID=UPI002BCF1231|nr:ABC transporter permease [Acidisoma sp.]HTI01557.1 ABC transporter permease [Acidisoma sp.]
MTVRAQALGEAGRPAASPLRIVTLLFLRAGVLPFFLVAALVIFSIAAPHFCTVQNLTDVARQSVYLVLVSLGQMLVLITGGFDLSVGTAIALTSVVSATVMVAAHGVFPHAEGLVIALGLLGGLCAALVIGVANGIGVSVFGVSPFIMTLGVQSVGAGIALFLTGGVPIGNLPDAFGDILGFGRIAGIPVPVLVALVAMIVMWVVMNRMRMGAQIYAVGGNVKAAHLSGIHTGRTLFIAYLACAVLASIAGMLLTARVNSGETDLGSSIALQSIAACVIAGVSLRGGIGRVESVVLGAFFITLVQNGMDVMQVGSYMQMVLLGSLLIVAVIVDQLRYRMLLGRS